MQPMQVDGSKNVIQASLHEVQLPKQLDLASRDGTIDAKFASGYCEVLLKNLDGDDSIVESPAMLDQIQSGSLLGRGATIIRIDQDIRIQETKSGHGHLPW
ncbi:MAG: hypothetical protein H6Q05_3198 [Acidobacteria bacterium]|nr:hypothetical protein [Acidobacteriota bacterium]